jgi:hypothetical protein
MQPVTSRKTWAVRAQSAGAAGQVARWPHLCNEVRVAGQSEAAADILGPSWEAVRSGTHLLRALYLSIFFFKDYFIHH